MTKNAWILVNRYCLTFNIYRPFLVDSSGQLYKRHTQWKNKPYSIQSSGACRSLLRRRSEERRVGKECGN